MDAQVRAGVAIYNAGGHHAAHDAWEDRWLELTAGTEDERFLHGLIQFTAAVYHVGEGNRDGARGLAESAVGYLAGLPSPYRGVDLGPVRAYLDGLAEGAVEGSEPPTVTYEGEALRPENLDFPAAAVAAVALAEAEPAYEAGVVRDAVRFAEAAVRADEADPFPALVVDFIHESDRRSLVYDRLAAHVERRRSELADVEGLFEDGR